MQRSKIHPITLALVACTLYRSEHEDVQCKTRHRKDGLWLACQLFMATSLRCIGIVKDCELDYGRIASHRT